MTREEFIKICGILGLGMALPNTLMLGVKGELLQLKVIAIRLLGGLLNNTGEGYEITHRYKAAETYNLSFLQCFVLNGKILFLSVTASEQFVFTLNEYRMLFFNSLKFKP